MVDQISARELQLFIENDSQLYHQQLEPIQKNLRIKQARGIYDGDKADKLFKYLADNGARRYGKEFGMGEKDGLRMFTPETRRAVAHSMRLHYENEASLGNYDYLLPKKYQHKGVQMMERA